MLSFAAIKLLRVKEAYRVLAGKDPSRIAPHKIEEFLGQADLLRKKVLDQFARYRTEWRNPFHARLRSRFRRGRRPDGNRICHGLRHRSLRSDRRKLPFDTAADPRAPAATPTTRQAHRCLT